MVDKTNIQLKLSFNTIKYILLSLISVLLILHIVADVYIDDVVNCDRLQEDTLLCNCANKELKNHNIIKEISYMSDDAELKTGMYLAAPACASKLFKGLN
jgi:hypothetical protein